MTNKFFSKVEILVDKNKEIAIFLLFFPYVYHISLPNGSISILEFLFSRLVLINCFFMILFFIYKKKKITKLLVAVTLFCGSILLSTILNNVQNINKAILATASYLGIVLLITLFKDDIKLLIKSMMFALEIQVYPNLLTVLLYRNVIEQNGYNINNFFLGTANDLILYLLPAFFLSILYIKKIGLNWRPIVLILIVLITSLLIDSLTTVVSLFTFLVVFIYCIIISKNKINNAYIIMLIPLLVYAVVVLPYVFFKNNPLIQYIFDNIYYNHSFECRVYIWASSKQYIVEKPLLGYGYYNNDLAMIGNESDIYALAHNTLLQTVLNYGFFGLIIFLTINTIVIESINRMNDGFYKSFYISIICCILITFITQDYHRFFEFLIIYSIIVV